MNSSRSATQNLFWCGPYFGMQNSLESVRKRRALYPQYSAAFAGVKNGPTDMGQILQELCPQCIPGYPILQAIGRFQVAPVALQHFVRLPPAALDHIKSDIFFIRKLFLCYQRPFLLAYRQIKMNLSSDTEHRLKKKWAALVSRCYRSGPCLKKLTTVDS